jgi:fructose-1-phosphate kinase PfkB-like protein
MVFDVISFIAGVVAGALAASLAGFLYGLERTADIQEKLRLATSKADLLTNVVSSSGGSDSINSAAKMKVDELQRDLDEIQEEIKRMYKRTTR